MNSWRRLLLVTHRWIGLSTSLVLIIAGGTGAMMVWGFQGPFRRSVGRVHENLALGRVGIWIVMIATAGAIVLQLGGVILWWRRKTVRVRTTLGWRTAVIDLHHSVGLLGLLLMLTIAATGVGMRIAGPGPVRRTIVDFHTSRTFPVAVDVLYAMGSLGFLVQGVTGVVMWWKPRYVPTFPLAPGRPSD
ncbi:MAG: PepSY domain-containing protein [Vicinamibacterales bacterium]